MGARVKGTSLYIRTIEHAWLMWQSQLNLEDLQLGSILYRYGSPEAEVSIDTFENVRNLRDACLAMARQGLFLTFFCSFSMYSPVPQLQDTVLLFGTILSLDPVHFRKYEACLLIGSILNFEALLGAPAIKST